MHEVLCKEKSAVWGATMENTTSPISHEVFDTVAPHTEHMTFVSLRKTAILFNCGLV